MLQEILTIDQEVIHYYEKDTTISSKASVLKIKQNDQAESYQMPRSIRDYFFPFRIFRRLLRIDKCNVFKIDEDFVKFLVLRRGKVYIFDRVKNVFEYKFDLKNCRNVLHNSICQTPSGKIIFGEYGANPNLKPVPIYFSDDYGQSWCEVNLFSDGEIKHIHCIRYDPYTADIWVMTGDYKGQCKILICDNSLQIKECIGDGGQDWRTCDVIFREEFVFWGMDSPLKPPFMVKFSRKMKTIDKIYSFDGPVWYVKSFSDGVTLVGVTVEPGPSVQTKSAQIIATKNFEDWNVVAEFEKDIWSMKWFKFGVLCFADGRQTSENFALFGEGLKNFDGISRLYKLDKERLSF